MGFEFGGCQGRDKTPTITEKICPQCGNTVELFSIDSEMKCENCGFVIYNDIQSCVRWCSSAKLCVGPELYEQIQKRIKAEEERAAESQNTPSAQK